MGGCGLKCLQKNDFFTLDCLSEEIALSVHLGKEKTRTLQGSADIE